MDLKFEAAIHSSLCFLPFKNSNDVIGDFLLLARAGGLLDRLLAPDHVDDGGEAAGEEDGEVHGHHVVVGLGEVAHQVTSHVQAPGQHVEC